MKFNTQCVISSSSNRKRIKKGEKIKCLLELKPCYKDHERKNSPDLINLLDNRSFEDNFLYIKLIKLF